MNSNLLVFRRWARWLPMLLVSVSAAAIAQADPPARVATLTHIEGAVAFARAGETDWSDAAINRPITHGDRVWTEPGARAEAHLGSATLHMNSQTFVEVRVLDEQVLQLNLNEGVFNARVRQLAAGDNFEISTPHVSFRALSPGDYRIDVDPARGTTRVTVRSGAGTVSAGGNAVQLNAGQQMASTGRDLAPAYGQPSPLEDAFDRWAGDRNRNEDQSISARYVPREVVGYQQLDAYGVWSQDPDYGPVWYPQVVAADWAPYRYGRWEWVVPWGWTWIDDAPWGFAPSHYGRWAQIGSRWCWVPGRIGPRPVYAPALVAFMGGDHWNLAIGSGPGIAWFPLAPGEAWRPTYRASSLYLRNVNRHFAVTRPAGGFFFHQRRPDAITSVRVDDFHRGRPVHQFWNRVNPADLPRVPIQAQPRMPEPRRWAEAGRIERQQQQSPRPQPVMPDIVARPQPPLAPRTVEPPAPAVTPRIHAPSQQQRAQEDQRRQHERQLQQERVRRDQQVQQQQIQQERQREHAVRQQQAQRERELRHEQATQERIQRQQQRVIRQPAAQAPPQVAVPATVPQPVQPAVVPKRGERRERPHESGGRGPPQQRRETPAQTPDENGRGRSRGHVN